MTSKVMVLSSADRSGWSCSPRPLLKASSVAVLWNPTVRDAVAELRTMQVSARALKLTLKPTEVKNADDLARVFALLEKDRPDGLTMLFDPLASGYRQLIAEFAKKQKLPTIFGAKEFAEVGGAHLLSTERRCGLPTRRSLRSQNCLKAPGRAIYRSSRRSSSSWLSTSRP